jgi:copper(I)-binding protein
MRHNFAVLGVGILLATALASPASAQHGPGVHAAVQTKGPLRIEGAWARATPPAGKVAGAFVTLVNTGAAPDRLVSAASPVAGRIELHTHIKDGDVMRMREVEGGIPLPPGDTVKLQPGGLHIMLLGLNQGLAAGSSFSLTLTFENAGSVQVDVPVEAMGSMGPGGQAGMHSQ